MRGVPALPVRWSRSIVRPSRKRFWRASFSVMKKARSPAPLPSGSAVLNWRTAAPSFSMKSPKCLRNSRERAALLSRGELILPEHLPSRARAVTHPPTVAEPMDPQRLEEIERQAIIQALLKHSFNRTETAKALGISRRALIYKLQRL